MKFTKKVGVILAGTALLGTNLIGLPISATQYVKVAKAAIDGAHSQTPWDKTGKSYIITGLQTINETKVGKPFTLPNATFQYADKTALNDEVTELVLMSPSNKNVSEGLNGGDQYTPNERGTYILYYILKSSDGKELARSETIEIKVTGADYEFEFNANPYFNIDGKKQFAFLPEETSSQFWFTLPMPKVLITKNGKEKENANVKVEVKSATGKNVLTFESNSTYSVGDGYANDVKFVDAKNADGEDVKAIQLKTSEVGIYKVSYTFEEENDKSSLIETIYDIQSSPVDNFKPNEDRELSATTDGTGAPTTAVIGNEVTMKLPKVTNKEDSNDEVIFGTSMEVVYVDKNGNEFDVIDNVQGKRTDISKDFKFTPKREGLYRVYYKVYDAFNNTTKEQIHLIENVSDSEAPKIYIVENYEVNEDKTLKTDEKNLKDGKYILPTLVAEKEEVVENYGADTESGKGERKTFAGKITIPAVYATDNAKNFEDIKLTRTVRLKSGSFDNKLTSFVVADEWKKQNPGKTYPGENQAVEILLEKATEYTIEYSAYDGSRYSYDSYTVTVKGGNVDNTLPSINDLKVGYTYTPGTDVVFSRPTATDNVDTRLKVETRYFYGDSDDGFVSGIHKWDETFKNKFEALALPLETLEDSDEIDKDNYRIPTADKRQTLYIVSITTDYNNRFVKPDEEKEVTVLVTKVSPSASVGDNSEINYIGVEKSLTDDASAPINKDSQIGYFDTTNKQFVNVHQHYEVQLPYLEFSDEHDKNFGVSVYVSLVTDDGLVGKTYTGSTVFTAENATTGNYIRIVNGGKFVPTKAATYMVTYVARDAAGHITSVTFPMIAKDTEKPIVLPQGYKSTMELGETQTFYQAVITDNGEKVNNPENVKMFLVDYGNNRPNGVNPTNDGFDAENKTFTPKALGDYHFKFSYEDAAGNVGESDIIKVTVQDTIKPTITLINSSNAVKFSGENKTTYHDELKLVEGSTTDYESIAVPNFTAEDVSGKEFITYSFSVKKDGTNIWTDGEAGKGGDLSFKPGKAKTDYNVSANGIYEITYSATDRYGNTQTQVYNLAVGDVEKPVIEFIGTKEQNKKNQPSGTFELNNKGYYELKIDTNLITAKDNSDEFSDSNSISSENSKFGQVTVYLSGSNGEIKGTNANGVYTFKIEKTGSYTLRYSVTDKAGNYQSSSHTFEVVEKEGKTSFGTIFWSVTLSIVALAGLGVALFFLLRDKNKKKPKKEKVNKDNDDDKVVV